MTLQEALAEVKRITRVEWRASFFAFDEAPDSSHHAIATILNAVASGELIPASDARLAVALAYRRAAVAADCGCKPDKSDCLCKANTVAFCYREGLPDILALAPADDLAEVEALRKERDDYADQIANLLPGVNREAVQQRARAEAAEAEVARLRDALERSKRLRDQYREALDAERAHSNPARAALAPTQAQEGAE